MSLINQMLKDLQEQQKEKPSVPAGLQPGTKERNSLVSTPVILICAGVVVLGLTWWAGSFLLRPTARIESTAGPVEHRQADQPAAAAAPAKVVIAEPAQAPAAKQEAVPAATAPPVVVKQGRSAAPETVKLAAKASPPVTLAAQAEPKATSKPVATTPKPAESAPSKAPRKEVAEVAHPLNPEKLPGAIQSSARNQSGHKEIAPPGSSYKMAEQSYLEGKQALAGAHQEQAIQSLQQALQLYAGHLPARELLAGIYDKAGRDQEAIALLGEGLKIAPDYIGFKKIHSRILANDGDFNAAITIMMRGGLPNIKEDPEAHEFMATLYHRLGESYLAAQTYRNLLAIWPRNGNYWFGLGDVLDKQGLFDDAIGCYRAALETKDLRQSLRDQAQNRLNLLGKGSPS